MNKKNNFFGGGYYFNREIKPDGRDGFQNIFLKKGYKTFVVDQPHGSCAVRSTAAGKQWQILSGIRFYKS